MHIQKVITRNYRCLRDLTVALNADLNILVGNNECGKSTFLEAVNLALTGLLTGRPLQAELHPYLFNARAVAEYIASLRRGMRLPPPAILIELYFADDPALARLKGINNSLQEDVPGVKLTVELDPDYAEEFATYVSNPSALRTLPVEYYVVRWRGFSDNDLSARTIPVKSTFIDASIIRNNAGAARYVVDILKEGLTKRQLIELALSYRTMKDKFLDDVSVAAINDALVAKKGEISNKILSVSLDASSRASWEGGIMPHLDDIPLALVGRGEQNSIKIRLALENSSESQLILIEEPENHLSYSSLNELIGHVAKRRGGRKVVITTHSSFVLNKLGVGSVLLFSQGKIASLRDLDRSTHDYFLKLPGHDTLRLILSSRAILVEGPSDELVIQRAFLAEHKCMPLEKGVDVITVGSLAFKRFLQIADLLRLSVDVVTDNDGNVPALAAKYADYKDHRTVRIHYDSDETAPTLEPQLLKANGRDKINKILEKSYVADGELLKYMKDNKTESALRFFQTEIPWEAPEYIRRAVT